MKVHKFLVPLSVLTLFAVAGCINTEQEFNLNADGSGTAKIHYWAQESVVSLISNEAFPFDEGKIKENYSSIDAGVRVDDVNVESITKDSTRHAWVTVEFDDITQLSKVKAFAKQKFTWANQGGQILFAHEILKEEEGKSNGLGMEEYKMNFTYHMPGEVRTSNALRAKGRELNWEYDLSDVSKGVRMEAKMDAAGFGLDGTTMIVIVSGVAVAGGLIGFITFRIRRKKKASVSQAQTANDVSDPSA